MFLFCFKKCVSSPVKTLKCFKRHRPFFQYIEQFQGWAVMKINHGFIIWAMLAIMVVPMVYADMVRSYRSLCDLWEKPWKTCCGNRSQYLEKQEVSRQNFSNDRKRWSVLLQQETITTFSAWATSRYRGGFQFQINVFFLNTLSQSAMIFCLIFFDSSGVWFLDYFKSREYK